MGFWSWLTGRDEREQDVYANKDQVEVVVANIKKIKANEVESAREMVKSAIHEINDACQYVAAVPVDRYDTLFDSIAENIENIGVMLQDKANNIIAYSESSWLEKGLSTISMGLFKVGEGILSVAEDLGDGVVSLIGWVAPAESGLEKACTDFVKKEWSHDAFNFYYESDFAKASLFTEDSALAAGCKIVGKAGAYLYAGGVFAGQASALGLGSTKLGAAALKVASSSTWGATAAAGLGGLGSGTETGLLRGRNINEAFANEGIKTAAVSGGLAFAGGKLGEKLAKNAAIKEANRAVEQADDAFKSAQADVEKYAKEMMDPNVTNRMADIAAENYDEALGTLATNRTALDAARTELTNVQNAGLSSFQGYSDALTRAGTRFGEASVNVIKDGANALGTTATASSAIRKGAVDAGIKTAEATSAQETFKESLKTLAKENPLTQGGTAIAHGASNIASGARAFVSHPGESLSNAGTAIKEGAGALAHAVAHPIETAGQLASVITTTPALPGIAAMTAVAAGQEIPNIQSRETFETVNQLQGDSEGFHDTDFLPEFRKLDVDMGYPEIERPSTDSTTTTDTTGQTGNTGNTNITGGGGTFPGGQTYPTEGSQQPTIEPTVPKEIEPTIEPTPEPTIEPTLPEKIEPEDIEPTVPEEIKPTIEPDPIKDVDPIQKDPTPSITPIKDNDPTDTTKKPSPTDLATSIVNPTGGTSTGGTSTGGGTTSTGGGSWSGHSGGGYSSTGGYTPAEEPTGEEPVEEAEVEGLLEEDASLDEIVKGKVTKIPTTTVPIQPKAKTKGSTAIPIAAGLSAAAAAGLGAKAYMDRKKNNDNGEDDEFYSDEWEEDESIQIDSDNVEENNENEQDYLTPDDEYSFATDEEVEKYGARKNNELADIQ